MLPGDWNNDVVRSLTLKSRWTDRLSKPVHVLVIVDRWVGSAAAPHPFDVELPSLEASGSPPVSQSVNAARL
jgi:hypothetical protein